MKKHSKLISALLTAVLMFGLAACGSLGDGEGEGSNQLQNTENSQAVKGRFMESQVSLPEGVSQIRAAGKLEDGTLQLAGNIGQLEQDCLLTSTDEGESWQVKELEGLNPDYITNVSIRKDGTVAYVGYFYEDDSNASDQEDTALGVKLVSREGEIEKVDFVLPQDEEVSTASEESDMVTNMVIQAAFDENGSLIMQDLYSTFYKLDIQTGELSEIYSGEDEYIPYFGIAGNRIYAVSESEMKIFSTQEGSMAAADSVLDEVAKENSELSSIEGELPLVMTKGMEENSLVYADHQGVFYHQENGSVSEQLINGELCSLGDPTLGLTGIVMLNEKSYLICAKDSMGNTKIFKYSYDENASAVPEKQLKVYALEDSNLLRQIASNFQVAHPDIFVKVEIGMSEENSITAEDAIRTLNTDILAGKGPDVLILDGMPVDSYIEKGILADIKGVVDEIDASEGIFSNIKNSYENNGSIYCMPCRFSIPVIAGDKEAVETGSAEGLLNYGKSIKEQGKRVFSADGATNILQKLFQVESADWFTNEGAIEQSKLEDYLETAKEMYDLDSDSKNAEGEESVTFTYTLYGYNLGTVTSVGRLKKENQISFGTLASLYELRDLISIEERLGGTYGIFNKEDSKAFVPYLMAGVISGKEEEQEVQEFIKTIFSKECGIQSESGFPVNKAAYEEVWQKELESDGQGSVAFCGEDGIVIEYDLLPLTQEEKDKLTENIESMTAPTITDRIISDLVTSEGSKYLEGSQTLEETSAAIMQKVNLYLSE